MYPAVKSGHDWNLSSFRSILSIRAADTGRVGIGCEAPPRIASVRNFRAAALVMG